MRYSCGCQRPDDDMGKGHAGLDQNGKAITTKTIQAADAFGETFNESLDHVIEFAQKVKQRRHEHKTA